MPDLLERLQAALADRYLFERELGRGGAAIVYLAEDRRHQRRVALKVLRPELAASVTAERFLREIRIAAQLSHPNILPLHDSGKVDGTLFYAMPYVAGESLRDRLAREHQLPIPEAVRITTEVAAALDYAHAQGIVHRDIKPENILFQDGRAVVTDFGIARAVTAGVDGETLTETGLAVGSPAYMSPEQGAGAADLDGRSDLYSLGCVLYEMLSGETPYTGPTPQAILAKKLTEPLPRITAVRETVPAPVEAALVKALARNAVDRHRDTGEFAAALQVTEPEWDRRRRVRRLAMLAGAAVLAGVFFVGGASAYTNYRARTDWRRLPLDSNVVVVVPPRVAAQDPLARSMGEGLPDLLYPVLTGDGAPRMATIGSVLRRWKDMESSGVAAEADAPLRLAAQLGAGLLLEPGLVQVGNRVTVNGVLLRVPDGREIASASVEAPLDEIRRLPRLLVVKLLGERLGESGERLNSVERYAEEAVMFYLQGASAYRAADYATAIGQFERAVAIDSTFALAALRGAQVPFLQGETESERYVRRRDLLRRALPYRESLGTPDRALLSFLVVRHRVDSLVPERVWRTTIVEILEAARAWTHAVPDDPEALVALAQFRAMLPTAGWENEYRRALVRGWELDSTTAFLVESHLLAAIEAGDVRWARRVAPHFLAVADTTNESFVPFAWVAGHLLGDSASVRGLRARAKALDERVVKPATLGGLIRAGFRLGLPLADADLIEHLRHRLMVTREDSLRWTSGTAGVEVGLFRESMYRGIYPLWLMSWAPIYPQLDSAARAEVIEASRHEDLDPPFACILELFRTVSGDTLGVREEVRRLEPAVREAYPAGVCSATIMAYLEALGPRTAAAPALERLDSIVRLGPWVEWPLPAAIVAVPRLFRQRGAYERALDAAAWRMPWAAMSWQVEPALLKEEAEIALIIGDTARAIGAYSQFLERWRYADDLARLWTDSVRETLAALTERSRGRD